MQRMEPEDEARRSAAQARLHYVADEGPGIRRVRRGRGVSYLDLRGRPIRDPGRRRRLDALAIPPAWTEVWICPDPRGHVQATGRDARGRKQYRYHAKWIELRSETKFDRLLGFGQSLPRLRRTVAAHLRKKGVGRERVLAAVVRLLESSCIRVGSDEYARANASYGLTTLRSRHVDVNGCEIHFSFRGKGGHLVDCVVDDPRAAEIVRRCDDLPGYELFGYVDETGGYVDVDSTDVNEYLAEHAGQGYTAKVFRTWMGSVQALTVLRQLGHAATGRERRRNVVAAIDQVADQLRNTRAIARSAYIHPKIFELYEAGRLREVARPAYGRRWLAPDEVALLRLLRA